MAFVQTRMALVKLLQIKTNKIITDKLRPRDYKRKIFQVLVTTPTEFETWPLPTHISFYSMIISWGFYLSTTMAANFQSLMSSASSSAFFILPVMNCTSLRMLWSSRWVLDSGSALLWSSTVAGLMKLLRNSALEIYFIELNNN